MIIGPYIPPPSYNLDVHELGSDSQPWGDIIQGKPLYICSEFPSSVSESTKKESYRKLTIPLYFSIGGTLGEDPTWIPNPGLLNVQIIPVFRDSESGSLDVKNAPVTDVDYFPETNSVALEPVIGEIATFDLRDYALDSADPDLLKPGSVINLKYDSYGKLIDKTITKPSEPNLDPTRTGQVDFEVNIEFPESEGPVQLSQFKVIAKGQPLGSLALKPGEERIYLPDNQVITYFPFRDRDTVLPEEEDPIYWLPVGFNIVIPRPASTMGM